MKRILILFFSLILVTSPIVAFANGNLIVHITYSGKCYHTSDCSFLHSDIEVTLSEAVDIGLEPCSYCDPPELEYKKTTKQNNSSLYTSDTKKPWYKAAYDYIDDTFGVDFFILAIYLSICIIVFIVQKFLVLLQFLKWKFKR